MALGAFLPTAVPHPDRLSSVPWAGPLVLVSRNWPRTGFWSQAGSVTLKFFPADSTVTSPLQELTWARAGADAKSRPTPTAPAATFVRTLTEIPLL